MSKTLTQLAKILALPDPMLQFKWVALSLPFGHKGEYMESIDLPFSNVAVSEGVYIGGRFMYFPGTHSISSFSASFYEDRNAASLKWIQDWKSKIKNFQTGAYGLPAQYKQDIVVRQLDQKNEPIFDVRLIDCWPSDTSPLSMNYTDGSGRVVIQQNFSVDDQEFTFFK